MVDRAVSYEFLQAFGRFVKRWVGPQRWSTLTMHEVVHGEGATWGDGPGGRGWGPPNSPWCMRAMTMARPELFFTQVRALPSPPLLTITDFGGRSASQGKLDI
jgi:hypothetical protein